MNFSPEASSGQGTAGDASAAPIAACPCTPKGRGRLPGHSRKPDFIGFPSCRAIRAFEHRAKRQLIVFVFSNSRLKLATLLAPARRSAKHDTEAVRAAKRPKGDNPGEQA